ncbi:MAG: hypothetical protein NTZ28_10695 [Nitrospirae bacterium]|nr:hypothetical protein [Nitrospirota bacterium]
MNVRQRRFRISCLLAGGLLVLLHVVGCNSATLVTRPIHTEPTWFVRLDTYQESEKSKALQYDHPAEWNEPELATILSRLLVQPEMGLLDRKRPPVPVFTTEEISRMTPILRTAFQQAQGSEWLSFVFLSPTGTNLEVTSGAFFIVNRRLHVVIANAREVVNQFATDVGFVRKNPMRSIWGVHGHLTFDPARFIVETASNWSGGSNYSASELVLDYREIQTVTMPFSSPAGVPMTAVSPGSGAQASREGSTTGPASLNGGAGGERDLARENRDLSAQVRKLETQIEALTRRLTEQESVLLQLRKDIDAVRSTKTRKDSRPSP